jgi:hypothetical protein
MGGTPISFDADIQPYFEAGVANCVACHIGASAPFDVKLDSYDNIIAGGMVGANPLVLVVAGDSTAGALIPKLEANHNNGPDDAGFVVTLSQWIDEGALDN